MSFCEYCQVGSYQENCICTRDNDICPLVRRCNKEYVWLPLDTMQTCGKKNFIRKENVKLGKGEYLVVNATTTKLYVQLDKDIVIRTLNPFDEIPEKVEIVEVDNSYYVKGYEPKTEVKKDKEKGDK